MFIRLTATAAFLCMSIAATTTSFAAENKPAPTRSGEEVFKQSCATCHAVNFPNAPQAHDTAAWQKKYEISETQAKAQFPALRGKDLDEKTMEILVSKVRNGNHAMPPKGLCNDCTDQEYQNAIEFMSKK
jgi:cytochrome c5